jgi:iron complex transport system ATP-binding protein
MTQAQQIITLDNITVNRSGTPILEHVSFTAGPGEHWALLGPNGSGKTTILNIITGYIWPSKGTVTVLGDRYGRVDLREKRRQIGLVSSSLYERLPMNETFLDVVLSGRFASLGTYDESDAGDRGRAGEIAAFLGREHISDRPWRVLSFGERQSALIGRALMAAPSILILDEPFEGLDLPTREHLIDRIDTLMADPGGPTVLFVTHRIEELPPGITHAALMRGGMMQYHGPAGEVLTSAAMTDTFGIPIEVLRRNGRFSAHTA